MSEALLGLCILIWVACTIAAFVLLHRSETRRLYEIDRRRSLPRVRVSVEGI